MKKKLLAAAVVGALAAPAAFAQTLYGRVDLGYQNADYSDGDTTSNFIQSGMATGSRLGVRGSEDLDGGTYVMYQYELNTVMDDGDDFGAPARISLLGLGNKGWGELTVGRQYTHTFNTFAVGSSIAYGTFASMYGNTNIETRANNSVKYSSPNFNGFTVGALWAPGENQTAGSASDGNYMDFALRWTPGPFGAALSHATATSEALGVDADATQTQVTGHWDNKAFGVYGGWIMAESDATTAENDTWHVNGVARFGGRHEIHLLFGHSETDLATATTEGDVWGIAYKHRMSKRTYMYAGYGSADNDTGAALVAPTNLAGTPTIDDPSGFQIGVVHSF